MKQKVLPRQLSFHFIPWGEWNQERSCRPPHKVLYPSRFVEACSNAAIETLSQPDKTWKNRSMNLQKYGKRFEDGGENNFPEDQIPNFFPNAMEMATFQWTKVFPVNQSISGQSKYHSLILSLSLSVSFSSQCTLKLLSSSSCSPRAQEWTFSEQMREVEGAMVRPLSYGWEWLIHWFNVPEIQVRLMDS